MNARTFLKQCLAETILEGDSADASTISTHKKSNKDAIKIQGKEVKLENFIKECLAEVIVEPIPRSLQATQLVKECLLEVLKENLSTPSINEGFMDAIKSAMSIKKSPCKHEWKIKKTEHFHWNPDEDGGFSVPINAAIEQASNSNDDNNWQIKKIHDWKSRGFTAVRIDATEFVCPKCKNIHVSKYYTRPYINREKINEGGFDPQSQAGPNVPMENPYPQWNSQMAKMEEDNTATAADFDEPQSWKKKGQKVQITFFKNGKNETQIGVIKEPQTTQAIVKPDKGYNTIVVPWKYIKPLMNAQFGVNETEGRYAQTAGAGQFDPRTFGVNGEIDDVTETNGPTSDSTGVQWQCPHCKKETKIPVEVESPSDYIACADCEHCCKEIADPRLDAKIYECVISHFAGECSPTLKG
jgi:hypothetical protein